MATRIIAYVDGFNLFHAVDDLVGNPNKKRRIPHNKLNLWSLIEDRKKPTEDIVKIHYFSAYALWLPNKATSHRRYVKALKDAGVTVTMSKFKEKQRKCKNCGTRWIAHEEKETDVRLALQILEDAEDDKFDRAYIVSADSDLAPAVRSVRRRFPQKGFFVLSPPSRYGAGRDLNSSAHASDGIMPHHIKRNLFNWKK